MNVGTAHVQSYTIRRPLSLCEECRARAGREVSREPVSVACALILLTLTSNMIALICCSRAFPPDRVVLGRFWHVPGFPFGPLPCFRVQGGALSLHPTRGVSLNVLIGSRDWDAYLVFGLSEIATRR